MDRLFEDSKPKRGASAQKTQNAREIFEALCVACDLDWGQFTKRERGKVNAVTKELAEVDATVIQIQQRAEVYKRVFPGATLTPCALSGNWAFLGTRLKGQTGSPASVCEAKGHVFEDYASYCTRCGRVPKPKE